MALVKYVVFHPWRSTVVVGLGVLLGTSAFYAYELNAALGVVASEDFDPAGARQAIAAAGPDLTPTTVWDSDVWEQPEGALSDPFEQIESTYGQKPDPRQLYPNAFSDPIGDEELESYLLVGADKSGYLADAIVLALQPSSGGAPIMVSLPRDLYVWNVCKERFTKLNAGLGGCKGVASGSELLAIMVEDYTGIPIDHLARVNFDGFARMVDAMGGITVCVDYPTRDIKAHLEINDTGCQRVGGEIALGWVRSRSAEELRGEEWVKIGGSDFGRQKRQQDVLFQLAARASNFSSPGSLSNRLSAVASSVRLDSSWSFGSAIRTGWQYRGISKDSVLRFSIGVEDARTSGGAVLLPTSKFGDHLSSVWSG